MPRVRHVARLLALLAASASLPIESGCKYEFTAPDQPDLYKVPKRFDLGDERDLAVDQPEEDLAAAHDSSVVVPIDLAENKDGG